jgi:hypothetical protein
MSTPAINVKSATAAELLAFYNAHSGRESVKRFADRRSAEKRVTALLAERQFNVPAPLPEVSEEDAFYVSNYGVAHCPGCGVHLSNGVGHDGQEVNNKRVRHERFQFECLGCGVEFGPAVASRAKATKSSKTVAGPRPAMVESLKLDRRIVHIDTGVIYKNANRVYKAGLVSSAQGDRLSAVLYRAAKAGNRHEHVIINNSTFCLADA